MDFEKICVVGLGYIGLPTAAVIASRKKQVIGLDVNQEAVDTINRGEVHFVEPGLDTIVMGAVSQGYLKATTVPETADAYIIAVPTPFKNHHEPDLGFIEAASKTIAPVLVKGNLVILESTSPVGATEKMAEWLSIARPDLTFPQTHGEQSDVRIAHCPERVLPGQVIRELVDNDRVIGGMTLKCSQAAISLYRIFVEGDCVATNVRTAELTKLTENSFRDVNIAFANELSNICEHLNVDVWELIKLANRHPRVDILNPGPGVGGHCIAVDPWFIIDGAPDDANLIFSARNVNDNKPNRVVKSIVKHANRKSTKTVVCLGATYKPNIDDIRESPAIQIIKNISKLGFEVKIVDSNLSEVPNELCEYECELISLSEAIDLKKPNVLALLVGHKEFVGSKELRLQSPVDFCGALAERRDVQERRMDKPSVELKDI